MILITLLVLLWRWWMHPQALPAELIDAARAVTAVATKWGQVADSIMSWQMPVTFAIGMIGGALLLGLFARKPS